MERKRITLHPVLDDGTVDTNVNLYPKTFLDGIVNREGEEVKVATEEDVTELQTEIEEKANNDAVVHLTGDEDIDGVKNFTSGIMLDCTSDEQEGYIVLKNYIQGFGTLPLVIHGTSDFGFDICNIDTIYLRDDEGMRVPFASLETGDSSYISLPNVSLLRDKLRVPDTSEWRDERTIATIEDIQKLAGYLDFWYSDRQGRLMVDLQDWMTNVESFEDTKFLSVNGCSFAPYFIEKNITKDGGYISMHSDRNFISLECDGNPQEQDNWHVNASQYFAPEYIFEGDELYPAIFIDNGAVVEDNVINPRWITNFGDRLDSLLMAPTKAWLFTGPDERELVEIYANRGSRNEYTVHIKTSSGDYKLTYQYIEEEMM